MDKYKESDFPIEKKFKTADEIEEYFSTSRLVCLLCGKKLRAMHIHLKKIHGLSTDEYREKYDLPWSRGLVGSTTRKKQSKIMKNCHKKHPMNRKMSKKNKKKLIKASNNPRPMVPATRDALVKRAKNVIRRTKQWQEKDYIEFIRRVKKHRSIMDVASDKDMPGRITFLHEIEENQKIRELFEKAWETVPNHLQILGHRVSKKLELEVATLRNSGHAWSEISKMLEINRTTCRYIYARWSKADKLANKDKYALPSLINSGVKKFINFFK